MFKHSVIVTTYKRYDRLELILKAWLKETPDVILANGGKWFNTKLPIRQFLYNPDPGNKIRFAAATLAKGTFITLADDDIIPKPGLLERFHFCWLAHHGIWGVIGRVFNNENYFKCSFIRADKLDKPVEVDFIGVIYFTHRKFINFDLQNLNNRAVDDLYWQMVAFPKAKKFVCPTNLYENLKPECNEPDCIFHDPKARAYRQEFYQKYRR